MIKNHTGIFGGSFNPVHDGHLSLIHSFLGTHKFDQILVIPSYQPPHKNSKSLADFEDRMEMVRLAIVGLDNVIISDIEKYLDPPNYTFNTLTALKKENPEVIYSLCIGSDSLKSFHTWYNARLIAKHHMLYVAERPGFNFNLIPDWLKDSYSRIPHKEVLFASHSIRESLKHGGKPDGLPDSVFNFIVRKNLYS